VIDLLEAKNITLKIAQNFAQLWRRLRVEALAMEEIPRGDAHGVRLVTCPYERDFTEAIPDG
jgi:hypothetical protein